MSQKWNLQDIRPTNPRPQRVNITRKPLPNQNSLESSRRTVGEHSDIRSMPDEGLNDFNNLPNVEIVHSKKKARGRFLLVLVFVFIVLGSAVGISFLTGGAEINIYPKHRTITVNAEFVAFKEKLPAELTYEVLTLEATGERQVTAAGQENVQTQATGKIEITKTTPGTERLIKNTRFQTSDGKVYRVLESVVVPGAVVGDNGENNPGRIQVEVFADEAGEEFNLPAKQRLTVPGFAESNLTELFNSIYATNPEPLSGGFNGPRYIIDETELTTARQALQAELRDSLLEKLDNDIPVGFTTFKDAVAISYTELPAVQYGDSLVTIREQALLQIPLFLANEFATFVAKETIVGFNINEGVRIANSDELRFSYSSPTTSQGIIANLDQLEFKIVGNPKIIWTFDAEDIKTNLVGKERTAHTLVLGKYPGIERSTIDIKPFWQRSFPDKLNKIVLNEIIE